MIKALRKVQRWLNRQLGREHRPWLRQPSVEGVFTFIHTHNVWNDPESTSGVGSTLALTRVLRRRLPKLLHDLRIESVLDIPCGDFNWLREVDLGVRDYVGADIVAALIETNQARYTVVQPKRSIRFAKLDLLTSPLPRADLVLCRDCLVHFTTRHVWQALGQIKRSRASYLLTTTYPESRNDRNIATGEWQPLNLEAPPFSLPAPRLRIHEDSPMRKGKYADKALGLWSVASLPAITDGEGEAVT
jgi:SAM-dependent methyltransferase